MLSASNISRTPSLPVHDWETPRKVQLWETSSEATKWQSRLEHQRGSGGCCPHWATHDRSVGTSLSPGYGRLTAIAQDYSRGDTRAWRRPQPCAPVTSPTTMGYHGQAPVTNDPRQTHDAVASTQGSPTRAGLIHPSTYQHPRRDTGHVSYHCSGHLSCERPSRTPRTGAKTTGDAFKGVSQATNQNRDDLHVQSTYPAGVATGIPWWCRSCPLALIAMELGLEPLPTHTQGSFAIRTRTSDISGPGCRSLKAVQQSSPTGGFTRKTRATSSWRTYPDMESVISDVPRARCPAFRAQGNGQRVDAGSQAIIQWPRVTIETDVGCSPLFTTQTSGRHVRLRATRGLDCSRAGKMAKSGGESGS